MLDQKSWCFPIELSKQEERICARLKRNGKLFVFLRQNRHLIFTEEVHQDTRFVRIGNCFQLKERCYSSAIVNHHKD